MPIFQPPEEAHTASAHWVGSPATLREPHCRTLATVYEAPFHCLPLRPDVPPTSSVMDARPPKECDSGNPMPEATGSKFKTTDWAVFGAG